MVIVRLCGGLGNQMFQYVAGYALARLHGSALRFDTSWFETNRLHNGLELDRVFGLTLAEATASDKRRILGWAAQRVVYRVLARKYLKPLRPRSMVMEPHFHYWPGFADLPDDVYLDGYWQSERYFASVAPELRERFRFALPLDPRSADLVEAMAQQESVSIHVRRGDFVSDPSVNQVHGVDLSGYYRAAIAAIRERVRQPIFYVFSDEPQWVRQHLEIPAQSVIVDHNRGEDSYRDMQLMSACRHHILANSSFSWWAAWLNPREDKIVIAPRQWFAVADLDTRDLYCQGWIVL
ncbi:alpha-1,2-fucosyltransferase [Thiobacter aerophilum]|uniref:Alpha-1,2-fucosyltransferase n=1 Tax=Thiobacter aerophilum TaxID=3121275 RepID=A0ABV0ED36_9BURK